MWKMNKAKLLKMYMGGEHVNKISQECGCSVKTVYKVAAAHGLHREGRTRAIKPKPKPRPVVEEPMYREIPPHSSTVQQALQEERERMRKMVDDRKKWQNDHKKWFSLRSNKREYDE